MTRRPLVDAFQVVFQDLDSTIEYGAYRKESFSLGINEVFGRPAWKKSENLIGDRISPIAHLIGDCGFFFSRFFDHVATPMANCIKKKGKGVRPLVPSLFQNKHSATADRRFGTSFCNNRQKILQNDVPNRRSAVAECLFGGPARVKYLSSDHPSRLPRASHPERIPLRVRQQKHQRYQPETKQ